MRIIVDGRYIASHGVGTSLLGVLQNIDYSRNEITIFGNKKELEELKMPFKIIEVNKSPLSFLGMFDFKLSRLINKYDAFFSPYFPIPYGVKIKCYCIIHDTAYFDVSTSSRNYFDKKIKRHFLKRSYKKCDTIFTVSKFSKKQIKHHLGNSKKEIVVLNPGVLNELIEFKNANKSIKKENYAIFVGSIKANKSICTIIDAFEKMNWPCCLHIVGTISNIRTIDKNAWERIKNNKNIILKENLNIDEYIEEISKANVLIESSTYEGFGLPPLEARFLGTNVITSNIEPFYETYLHNEINTFKVLDVDDLVLKFKENKKCNELSDEFLQKYSMKKYSEKIIEEIERNEN